MVLKESKLPFRVDEALRSDERGAFSFLDPVQHPLRTTLGKSFERYKCLGQDAKLFAMRIDEMPAEERAAAIGWLIESNRWWRDFATGERLFMKSP